MNEQNYRERFNTLDVVDRTGKNMSDLVAYSEPLARVPVEAAPIGETLMEGTVTAVGPMDERIVREAPMAEAIPYAAPVGEPVADEFWMSKPILTVAPVAETITHKVTMPV